MEKIINLHIEKLLEGYYLATIDVSISQVLTLAEGVNGETIEQIK